MKILKSLRDDTKFSLSLKDISYSVKLKDKSGLIDKTILDKISTVFYSGNLNAIIGPSGSGKTSLLNILTDNIDFKGNSEKLGEYYINNEKVETSYLKKYCGYVLQDDLLNSFLTPYETLRYVAQLRNSVSCNQLDDSVIDILRDLKLEHCQDTRIGSENVKGISGGERKRVSIGVELISNPSILIIDEPTSGLDSQTSKIVISLLKELAVNKNKLIITVIHQPSSSIFKLFDNLMVVNRGKLVYTGPSVGVLNYFEIISRPLSIKSNPIDSIMHHIELGNGSDDYEYFSIQYNKYLREGINEEINQIVESNNFNFLAEKSRSSTSVCSSIAILSSRLIKISLRNPMTLIVRIIFMISFTFVLDSIWFKLDYSELGEINRVGLLYVFCIIIFFQEIFTSMNSLPNSRPEFIRDYNSNLYGVVPYYLSKNIVETPIAMLSHVLFLSVNYFVTGLRLDPKSFFVFLIIYIMHGLASQSLGFCIGAMFKTREMAILLSDTIKLPAVLFGGLLINPANMPNWLFWFKYLSPFYYTFQTAVRNEFEDNINLRASILGELTIELVIYEAFYILLGYIIFVRLLGMIFLKLTVDKTG